LPTFAAVLLILGGCGMAASYLPALRAASVDPADSIRPE
jgi:ABC-type antimicrobial peptide transport system permease subunit